MIPVIDVSVNKLGLANTLHLTNGLGVVYGVLVLVTSLELQLATFAVYTMFRAFLYATMSTYIAQVFGLATLGRKSPLLLPGLVCCCCCCCCCLLVVVGGGGGVGSARSHFPSRCAFVSSLAAKSAGNVLHPPTTHP